MGQDEFYSATSRFDAGEKARTLSRKVDFPEGALPSIGEKDRMDRNLVQHSNNSRSSEEIDIDTSTTRTIGLLTVRYSEM
ncbi:hypothetical protein CCR75_007242 [Bremia lactucae]|uniref:Uncharacterized protein n=1 Tax=Bremia lactucae TaxID=4779 RepID=A0A976FMQ6_BRELC|nr:hypothetical protein CCR75_007242 [Bremia lactucae]